jgi:hypothetical protein
MLISFSFILYGEDVYKSIPNFNNSSEIWGVWTPGEKKAPFSELKIDGKNYLTTKYQINTNVHLIFEKSENAGNRNHPAVVVYNWGPNKIIDCYKTEYGYLLLLERSNSSGEFPTGLSYDMIIYRICVEMHFIDDNTCWFKAEDINFGNTQAVGSDVLGFGFGKEITYWREIVKN